MGARPHAWLRDCDGWRKWKIESRKWKFKNRSQIYYDFAFNFLISIFQRPSLSSHGADFFRLDLVGDADFAGFAEGIHGVSQILFGKFVDVGVRTVFRDFHDAPADFQIAVRIRGILKGNRNAGI